MASIKIKFRPSVISEREGTIYYQLIHCRQTRRLMSDYRLLSTEWDAKHSTVILPRPNRRTPVLLAVRDSINREVNRLLDIIRRFDESGHPYTVDDIIEELRCQMSEFSLFNFMETTISRLAQNGKTRTSAIYRSTLNSFKRFRKQEDILLEKMSPELLEDYQLWLYNEGLTPNSVSFYMRVLRAVYNRAVEKHIVADNNPFKRVYTGIDKTRKRALSLSTIRKIKSLDLSGHPALQFARDMFIMSFMLRGMSLIDMAYLRTSDCRNGYVTYRRRKTGQKLTIAWTKDMQKLVEKYPQNDKGLLLPILSKGNIFDPTVYRNVAYNVNHNLKTVGKMVGITSPLTIYVARHSWASVTKERGVPLSVISEGMGHQNESTTRIYLSTISNTTVDSANAMIMKYLG